MLIVQTWYPLEKMLKLNTTCFKESSVNWCMLGGCWQTWCFHVFLFFVNLNFVFFLKKKLSETCCKLAYLINQLMFDWAGYNIISLLKWAWVKLTHFLNQPKWLKWFKLTYFDTFYYTFILIIHVCTLLPC